MAVSVQAADPGLGEGRRVASVVGVDGGATLLKGSLAGVVRLRGQLQLTPALRLGAEGLVDLGGVVTTSENAPDRPELRLGYGGVRVDYGPRGWPVAGSLLLAAGSVRVRSNLLGTDVARRNIVLVEPGARLELGRLGPLRYGVGVAARVPLGAPSLPGVRSRDLLGGTLSLTLEWPRAP